MNVSLLSRDPVIYRIDGFLSASEARSLIMQAEGHFQRSGVVCDKPGGCISSYRTSSTAHLGDNHLTRTVTARGKLLSGMPAAESLQIVRYFPGQEFKPHLDAFDEGTEDGRRELARYGGFQRNATFLVYLNDSAGGGETVFPKIGLSVRPHLGSAIFWRNVQNGRLDPRVWHGGAPVTSGTKYACNLWMRGDQARDLRGTLGRMPSAGLGDFRPSPEADARQFGVRVTRVEYPNGYAGVRLSLENIARYIREGSVTPSLRAFAEFVIRDAGIAPNVQISNRDSAALLLDHVQKSIRYRPDPPNTEWTQSAPVTLCVKGAPMCLPVGDCDDMVVALGALCASYGIPVKVIKQTFSDDGQEHVLIAIQTDGGDWLPADACAPGKPLGWSSPSQKNVTIDPWDSNSISSVGSEAEFVGIGRLGLYPGLPIGPGDVLAYRAMWDPYVTGIARAAMACSAAWAGATAPRPLQGGETAQNLVNGEQLIAESILTEWNAYANIPDWQLVVSAPAILSYFQSVVLKAGALYAPQVVADCPGTLLPTPPSFDTQAYVIAQLEALGVIAHGTIQILGIGASGALDFYAGGADLVKTNLTKIVNAGTQAVGDVGQHLGWLSGAVIAVAVAVVAVEVAPLIMESRAVKSVARETRRMLRRGL